MNREQLLKEAKELGIVDVDAHSTNGSITDSLSLAVELMKKHGPEIYRKLDERRKQQSRSN